MDKIPERNLFVYTITSLYIDEDLSVNITPRRHSKLPKRTRLVGFYKTLERAKECVEGDYAAFAEAGYYNYIVIEGLWEGCYPGLGDYEWWYKHDWENNKWVSCEKPETVGSIVNFYG